MYNVVNTKWTKYYQILLAFSIASTCGCYGGHLTTLKTSLAIYFAVYFK